jgi:hypothetical protein
VLVQALGQAVQESSWRDALSKLLKGIDDVCVQLFLVPDLEGNAEGLYEGPASPWQLLWGFLW